MGTYIRTEEHRKFLSEQMRLKNKTMVRKPVSEETRLKISLSNKGKKRTDEQNQRLSLVKTGVKYPNRKSYSRGVTQIPKVCPFCKKDFVTDSSQPNKKFCSLSCNSKSRPEMNLSNLEKRDKEKQRLAVSSRVGSLHPRWIENRTTALENHRRRGLKDIKVWRDSVFNRDDYTCQECEIRGGYLEAHHIKTWRDFKDLRHDINNGITLCRPCHLKTMFKEDLFSEKYSEIIITKLTKL